MNPLSRIRTRWSCEGGYRELLGVAVPLILSTSAWSVQHFVDRVFLTWYSTDAIAASMPSGLLSFTILSLFLGTASYASTFVAQYDGAGRRRQIGPVVWQGTYIALLGALVHLALIPMAGRIFAVVGHAPEVQRLEVAYFRILCLGAPFPIAAAAMSGFYSGRGKTWPIACVSASATVVNVTLDYALIFGRWGCPELGMTGAAIATVISGMFACLVYAVLLTRGKYARAFNTGSRRFDPTIFARLLRYGLPSGIQFLIDMAGFTTFVLLVGRLGTTALAASNIAFNINTLAFMPMIGINIAICVLVGRRLGGNDPALARKSVYSGFQLTLVYMTTIAAFYLFAPALFLMPFRAHADPAVFLAIRPIGVNLLRFVAVYSIFDTMNLVFSGALKGAGDTRYVMRVVFLASFFLLVLPTVVALQFWNAGIYVLWTILSLYVIMLGFIFLARFRSGIWESMRVIEPSVLK